MRRNPPPVAGPNPSEPDLARPALAPYISDQRTSPGTIAAYAGLIEVAMSNRVAGLALALAVAALSIAWTQAPQRRAPRIGDRVIFVWENPSSGCPYGEPPETCRTLERAAVVVALVHGFDGLAWLHVEHFEAWDAQFGSLPPLPREYDYVERDESAHPAPRTWHRMRRGEN